MDETYLKSCGLHVLAFSRFVFVTKATPQRQRIQPFDEKNDCLIIRNINLVFGRYAYVVMGKFLFWRIHCS